MSRLHGSDRWVQNKKVTLTEGWIRNSRASWWEPRPQEDPTRLSHCRRYARQRSLRSEGENHDKEIRGVKTIQFRWSRGTGSDPLE